MPKRSLLLQGSGCIVVMLAQLLEEPSLQSPSCQQAAPLHLQKALRAGKPEGPALPRCIRLSRYVCL